MRTRGVFLVAVLAVGCGPTDVTLDKPKAGVQFAIAPFDVAKGEETQRCFFFEVPSDVPVFVNRFELAQNPGTHHLNVFRVKTIKDLGGKDGESVAEGECWKSGNWSDWPLVVNSQQSEGTAEKQDKEGYIDWQLPTGIAYRFEPRELLMIQSHYVNATTQKTPLRGKALVNFHFIDEAKVKAEVGTAFATNQNIKICPGDTNKYFESTCRLSASDAGTPLTIIAANGHFHSRGKKFTIRAFDPSPGSADPEPFYTSVDWSHPPMDVNLNVTVPEGGGFKYHCEFTAPANSCGDADAGCCFTFGPKVETSEHCNAFVYYYPKTRDVGCF